MSPSQQHLRTNRIPLSTYLSNPTSGASWPPNDHSPRSVSNDWYETVCPESERVQVNTTTVGQIIGVNLDEDDGAIIVSKWARYLKELDARCVDIQRDTPRIIDFGLVGLLNHFPLIFTVFEYKQHPRLHSATLNLANILQRPDRCQLFMVINRSIWCKPKPSQAFACRCEG